ncbi:hypothetical protein ACVBEH_06720 [Roseateles sp. GG27B]
MTTAVTGGLAAAPAAGVTGFASTEGSAGLASMNDVGPSNTAQQKSLLRSAEQGPEAKNYVATRSFGSNQFQRFVQESTGRLLPMYGHELFGAPQAYSADTNLPVPDDSCSAPVIRSICRF